MLIKPTYFWYWFSFFRINLLFSCLVWNIILKKIFILNYNSVLKKSTLWSQTWYLELTRDSHLPSWNPRFQSRDQTSWRNPAVETAGFKRGDVSRTAILSTKFRTARERSLRKTPFFWKKTQPSHRSFFKFKITVRWNSKCLCCLACAISF